jgi:hypothetical protein
MALASCVSALDSSLMEEKGRGRILLCRFTSQFARHVICT